jgi:hypothetical protein
VEAEKRYQEKRAAEKAGEPIPPPPVVLWRSVRELGVWVKDLRRARSAGALGAATYAAAELVDRAHVSASHQYPYIKHVFALHATADGRPWG